MITPTAADSPSRQTRGAWDGLDEPSVPRRGRLAPVCFDCRSSVTSGIDAPTARVTVDP
jgi:hypothetical protein